VSEESLNLLDQRLSHIARAVFCDLIESRPLKLDHDDDASDHRAAPDVRGGSELHEYSYHSSTGSRDVGSIT
jgi:hypothetical protein